eukprot:TRINITY_DN80136_c0_g1_i1.p2 TRINITY_DN80136_c0_g1~~TRINITY_DN80136_c0_g1_i1.p2  ORF type:complete len:119 (+),score=3.69 TRINITY_DN80136_c0_g1_i1:323-679(+)
MAKDIESGMIINAELLLTMCVQSVQDSLVSELKGLSFPHVSQSSKLPQYLVNGHLPGWRVRVNLQLHFLKAVHGPRFLKLHSAWCSKDVNTSRFVNSHLQFVKRAGLNVLEHDSPRPP